MTKPVAKSLHTITVLVQVAGMIKTQECIRAELAMDVAMAELGLAGRPDPHGLRDKALALLNKEG